ncbi:MAG: class I SAM-dependent methyltransferase [Elusimicrobia bacterium]|nr:class I SAM-dependent methyltransferase [Elusimicrobiota bacterium]
MTAGFKDLFSPQAADYRRHRPGYPAALFEYLASLPKTRRLALDCATGNGQAAVGLAAHFDRVLAVDLSRGQLDNAVPHPKVGYRLAAAEDTGLPAGSADLVASASGMHWFDLGRFYTEVRRVAAPGGVLAAWCYGRDLRITPEVDAIVERYAFELLGPYWEPEIKHVYADYKTLPFPFDELAPPAFELDEEWDLSRLAGDLSTWSSARRYREERGTDPFTLVASALEGAWGPPERVRRVRWGICMRVGRVS